jgi:hypothetical protein
VQTNTLPHVGDAPKVDVAPATAPEDKPFAKFARSFDNPAGKPLFAILLQDVGAAGMQRSDLADLPFAVTSWLTPWPPMPRRPPPPIGPPGKRC